MTLDEQSLAVWPGLNPYRLGVDEVGERGAVPEFGGKVLVETEARLMKDSRPEEWLGGLMLKLCG